MTYIVTGKTERTLNGISIYQLDLSNDQNMGCSLLTVTQEEFLDVELGDELSLAMTTPFESA